MTMKKSRTVFSWKMILSKESTLDIFPAQQKGIRCGLKGNKYSKDGRTRTLFISTCLHLYPPYSHQNAFVHVHRSNMESYNSILDMDFNKTYALYPHFIDVNHWELNAWICIARKIPLQQTIAIERRWKTASGQCGFAISLKKMAPEIMELCTKKCKIRAGRMFTFCTMIWKKWSLLSIFNALNSANHLSEYAANGVPMFDHDDRMQFSYMNRFRVG